jgi:hypothetical protein
MEISQPDNLLRPEQSQHSRELQFQKKVKEGLGDLKTQVTSQPFLCLAIAFLAGLVSHTFPARMIFLVVMKVASWLLGPAMLVLGVLKVTDLFFGLPTSESKIWQRP